MSAPPARKPAPRTIIYAGTPENGVDLFVGQFIAASAADAFTSWLVLPTRRLVREAVQKIRDQNIPLVTSRICTPDDLCRTYFEEHRTSTRFISPAESNLLLLRILNEKKAQAPLFFTGSSPSSGTRESFQEFINVVIRRKIAYPSCLSDLQSEKSRQIGLITAAYREHLTLLGLVDSDTILEWVIGQIKSSDENTFGKVFVYGLYEPLPLDQDLLRAIRDHSTEFTYAIPGNVDPDQVRGVMRWLGTEGTEMIPESGQQNPLTGIFRRNDRIDTGERIRTGTFPTRYREVAAVAEEIRRLHERNVPFKEIAVTFPEAREAVTLIGEIFSDFDIPWNTTTKKRISLVPIVSFLISISGVVAGQYSREDVVRLVGSPYFRYRKRSPVPGTPQDTDPGELDLVSRYAQIEQGQQDWFERLDRLHTRLSASADAGDIAPFSPESVERVHTRIRPLLEDLARLEGTKTLQEHTEVYLDLLSGWGLDEPPASPGQDETISREEGAALDKFYECLRSLGATAGFLAGEKIDSREFQQILTILAKDSEIPLTRNQEGVALLGVRECVHEHFTYLFLAGLTEGEMPRLTTRIPFTNTLENTRLGTRTLEEILREGRYYFVSALLGGSSVYLSAPLSDGEQPLLTSAFLEVVKARTTAVPWDVGTEDFVHSGKEEAIRAGAMIAGDITCASLDHLPVDVEIDDLAGRINMEGYYRRGIPDSPFDGVLSGDEGICAELSKRYGPEHVYSATTLETYAECPFRFYLMRITGLSALPEVEPNLSASDRGIAVHNVLTTFYRRWKAMGKRRVIPSELSDATTLMMEIASEELMKQSFQSPLWEATCVQMLGSSTTGPGIFRLFLEKEAAEEGSPLVPAFFELAFGMKSHDSDDPESVPKPVELTGDAGSESIRIKGRIDRIDLTPDGFFSISDYKTGSQLASTKDIEAGTALQLPLYLLAFEKISGKTGVAAGYYRIRREVDNKFVLLDEPARDFIISSRPRVTKDFRELLLRSHRQASGYIRRIRSGSFPLPVEEKCPNQYCEFSTICRFDPFRMFFTGEEA
ncbi:MAG: PD-(D/E)XK nuclease family protein [Methanoregula sp.]|nr:MAG: PD-(D/E)XK nuclease family protein [Methanoregula sp.]